LLWNEFKGLELNFNTKLWKKVMEYSYPLIIVGLGGMINDMLSRLVYRHVVDVSPAQAIKSLGIFWKSLSSRSFSNGNDTGIPNGGGAIFF
jgi:O-antigen/teichoic acid export membrane protein